MLLVMTQSIPDALHVSAIKTLYSQGPREAGGEGGEERDLIKAFGKAAHFKEKI